MFMLFSCANDEHMNGTREVFSSVKRHAFFFWIETSITVRNTYKATVISSSAVD